MLKSIISVADTNSFSAPTPVIGPAISEPGLDNENHE